MTKATYQLDQNGPAGHESAQGTPAVSPARSANSPAHAATARPTLTRLRARHHPVRVVAVGLHAEQRALRIIRGVTVAVCVARRAPGCTVAVEALVAAVARIAAATHPDV